jgi:hypothetical protein
MFRHVVPISSRHSLRVQCSKAEWLLLFLAAPFLQFLLDP